MSKPNMRLVGDAPPRTPEREQLAAAQERHSAARERLAAIKTAQERAFDSVLNLKDAAANAAAALEQAQADEPRQLVESFIGGDTAVVASPVKAAAAAVEEANARLATARQIESTPFTFAPFIALTCRRSGLRLRRPQVRREMLK
jgi:hypothetical protein